MSYVFDADRIGRWVCEKAGGRYQAGNTCFGIEKDGVLKAGVMFDSYTGVNGSISAHWRVEDPKALTKFFYWMCFDYAFNHAKAKRLTGLVHSKNEKARKVDKKLGFTEEATLENYFPDGDGIVYRMYRQDCRFIRD